MTKHSSKSKRKQTSKNKKCKRIKKNFSAKSSKSKKNSSKNLTANETQKHKIDSNVQKEANQNKELISQNMDLYSAELMNNHFETYANEIVTNLLLNESLENDQSMKEEILFKFNLTRKHRKSAFKFLLDSIKWEQIGLKCFFSTISLFDLFLVKYSEEENNEENCENFFKSKKTNEFSEKKLILFLFCCFYLVSKYYNTKFTSIEQILQFEQATNEANYDDLVHLIDDIMIYTEGKICNTNLYSFIEIFMIDILKHMRNLTKNEKFLKRFEYYVLYFSTRFVIELNDFSTLQSVQALGIIIFSYDYCKFTFGENEDYLDRYLMEWKQNLKYFIKNYDENQLYYILQWLNYYVSYKKLSLSVLADILKGN